MILDAENQLSDAQALTATAASTNVIDLSSDRNIGIGEAMVVQVVVDVAADTADADETYQFDVETDDNEAFSSATTIASLTVAGATLVAGYRFTIGIPKDATAERYLRVNYVLGGTTPSITVTTHLLPHDAVQAENLQPIGYTVS